MPVLKPLSGSGEAPQTFSQPSRKGKKAWRKNVDVTDVQKGLADLNDEIIQGGVIREKDSADLFAVDIKGDKDLPKKFPKHTKKGLKADEILAQRSFVPAVSQRKRSGDNHDLSKTSDGIVPAKRQRTDWVSNKELARLKKVADGEHANSIEIKDATYDLWDAAPSTTQTKTKASKDSEFLPTQVQAKAPKSMKQKPISLTANGKPVAAVAKPTGGYSYNPMFDDYEQRLAAESQKAVEAEQKRLRELEMDRLKQEAAARSAAEAEAAEARADLSEWEEDSEWEGFQSGAEDDGDDRPVVKRPQRKTPVQRNRAKRRKEEERLAKHRAQMKARRQQEHHIKDIAKEIEERDQSRALIRSQQQHDSEGGADEDEISEEKLRRKQLGKFKLPEKDLELVLPDELQDSLRRLRPEGNLLKDRYRNMLLRGKVEARRHIPFKKQAKRKFTEKWTHKDFVI